jgi:fermentation-respiration switch protein FrsA (DUF1100 family)
MVDHIFPVISYFKHLILRMYWPSVDRIPKIRIPLLFVVGGQDEIVPPIHAKRLHDAALSAPFKMMHQVPLGMHNDTWMKGGKEYIYALKDFIEKAQDYRQSVNAPAQNNQSSTAPGPYYQQRSTLGTGGTGHQPTQGNLIQRKVHHNVGGTNN